jgi:demethylmacrocin O-methyltransferase
MERAIIRSSGFRGPNKPANWVRVVGVTMNLNRTLSQWVDKTLPLSTAKRLRKARKSALVWWYRKDLNRLATVCDTDKWGTHWYTQHYDRYFRPMRSRRLNVLEIGVGGYESSDLGGGSLRMWKAYFSKSQIVGIDLYDKSHFSESRIDVRQCDQTDKDGLVRLSKEYGGFDIVIDDGSHFNEHVIQSFEVLFPLLRTGGIYVVEDVQTAYWSSFGGGINSPGASIKYFKALVDGLNHAEYPIPSYKPTYYDENIVEIAFFHNLVFICKGKNDEKTNCPDLIQDEIADSEPGSLNIGRVGVMSNGRQDVRD